MATRSERRGLIDRVVGAYWDFSASMRAMLAERPSDGTVLSFILLAAFVAFCGEVAAQTMARSGPMTDAELDVLTSEAVGRLLVAPLGAYLLSAIVAWLARLFGGVGEWYETRLAFGWSMIVSAPLIFAASIAEGLVVASGASVGSSGAVLRVAAAAPFTIVALYVWAACVSEAHRFSSPRKVLAVVIGVLAVGAAIAAGVRSLMGI